MKKTNQSFAAFKMIHAALLTGQLLFTGVITFVVYKLEKPLAATLDQPLQIAAILLAATAFFTGNAIFKKRLTFIQAQSTMALAQKFVRYRTACIIQWVLLELSTLFSGICFLIAGNNSFLALAGMLIVLFGLQAPSKAKLALQLYIPPDELNTL
ncbi:MAG: hypothetical protein WCJ85_11060 [Chitinophagaceae bacterium]